MKRKLHFSMALPLMLLIWTSCKKSSEDLITPITEAKKFEVSFKVTAFSQTDEPLSSKLAVTKSQSNGRSTTNDTVNEDAIENYIKRLDFFIYDGEGALIERVISHNEYYLTGKYNEKAFLLAAGNYRMIVVGSMGGLTFGDTTNYSTAYLQPKPVVEDIFYQEYKFDVNESDVLSNVINLKRIVASLEVRNRAFLTPNVEAGLPIVYVNSVNRFPFNPEGEYHYLYDGPPFDGHNYPGVVLPIVAGEQLWNRPVDIVYQGFVLSDRSVNFNGHPFVFQPASRSGDLGGFYIDNVILKPNFKKILTSKGYKSIGGEFVTITADSAWEDVEEETF